MRSLLLAIWCYMPYLCLLFFGCLHLVDLLTVPKLVFVASHLCTLASPKSLFQNVSNSLPLRKSQVEICHVPFFQSDHFSAPSPATGHWGRLLRDVGRGRRWHRRQDQRHVPGGTPPPVHGETKLDKSMGTRKTWKTHHGNHHGNYVAIPKKMRNICVLDIWKVWGKYHQSKILETLFSI